MFALSGVDGNIIFTGGAAKNRAEILSLTADMTYDPAVSRRSMQHIWEIWRSGPGSVPVPRRHADGGSRLARPKADGLLSATSSRPAALRPSSPFQLLDATP